MSVFVHFNANYGLFELKDFWSENYFIKNWILYHPKYLIFYMQFYGGGEREKQHLI